MFIGVLYAFDIAFPAGDTHPDHYSYCLAHVIRMLRRCAVYMNEAPARYAVHSMTHRLTKKGDAPTDPLSNSTAKPGPAAHDTARRSKSDNNEYEAKRNEFAKANKLCNPKNSPRSLVCDMLHRDCDAIVCVWKNLVRTTLS